MWGWQGALTRCAGGHGGGGGRRRSGRPAPNPAPPVSGACRPAPRRPRKARQEQYDRRILGHVIRVCPQSRAGRAQQPSHGRRGARSPAAGRVGEDTRPLRRLRCPNRSVATTPSHGSPTGIQNRGARPPLPLKSTPHVQIALHAPACRALQPSAAHMQTSAAHAATAAFVTQSMSAHLLKTSACL